MRVVFLGKGGHAKAVQYFTGYDPVAFLERGQDSEMALIDADYFVAAIGDNVRRAEAYTDACCHFVPAEVRHATACVMGSVEHGVQLFAGCVVAPGAVVKCNTIINTGSIVEHDCFVCAHAHIAPGAVVCGGVRVGEGVLVGAGAVVLPGVEIPAWSVVPAGSVVR